MAKLAVLVVAVMIIGVAAAGVTPSSRERNGYSDSSYTRGSDERDVSGSGEVGCSREDAKSGSREIITSYGGRQATGSNAGAGSGATSGYSRNSGRSYAKASAVATASSYSEKNKI